jgi:hypothetical protein
MAASINPEAPGVEVYEFRVRGELGADWSEWFDGMEVLAEDGETVLWGQVRDQSALYGLIAKLRNLGLTLVSVGVRQRPA